MGTRLALRISRPVRVNLELFTEILDVERCVIPGPTCLNISR